jgi:ribonuclease T
LLFFAWGGVDPAAEANLGGGATQAAHVEPFPGANIEQAALDITGIRIDHPLRLAMPEREALDKVLKPVRQAVSERGCTRALLVGHNAHFDLSFVNAACARTGYKRSPFHPFSVLDTATLAGAVLGQTVLKRALDVAGLGYDGSEAHSAIYDAERTADLFCLLVNRLRPVYDAFAAVQPAPEPADRIDA